MNKIIITALITLYVMFSLYGMINALDNEGIHWSWLSTLDKICKINTYILGFLMMFGCLFLIVGSILYGG